MINGEFKQTISNFLSMGIFAMAKSIKFLIVLPIKEVFTGHQVSTLTCIDFIENFCNTPLDSIKPSVQIVMTGAYDFDGEFDL